MAGKPDLVVLAASRRCTERAGSGNRPDDATKDGSFAVDIEQFWLEVPGRQRELLEAGQVDIGDGGPQCLRCMAQVGRGGRGEDEDQRPRRGGRGGATGGTRLE